MFTKMAQICENEYDYFFNIPNVNGIGIGHKEVNGINTGVPCLKIFVKEKLELDKLNIQDMVPKNYKGFTTDVIQAGEIIAHANTSKIRPAQGGYSVGLVNTNIVGTFGCLVSAKSGTALQTFILSNNHVIADDNNATIGTGILQPCPGDGGVNPTDLIATLYDFVSINFSGGNNYVDCAIGLVPDTSLVTSQIAVIGNPIGIASAVVGTPVQKSGRTTGYTTGTITSINTTLNVSYGGTLSATFIQQITATPMSATGDSGSVVLDMSNRVIGLLFAGSATLTAMNDIRNVLSSFRSRLI